MSKLAKRLTALLLSGMLIIGLTSGSVLAASIDLDPSQTSEIAEEVYDEDTSEALAGEGEMAESEDASKAPAGAGESYPEEASANEEAAQYYTVTLDANGGYFANEWDDAIGDYVERTEVLNKNIPVGGIVETVPVKESAAFLGWSLEFNGEILGAEYVPVDNCVLYAVWEVADDNAGVSDTEDGADEDAGLADTEQEAETGFEDGNAVEETEAGYEDTEEIEKTEYTEEEEAAGSGDTETAEAIQENEATGTAEETETAQETAEDTNVDSDEYTVPEANNEQNTVPAQEVIYSDDEQAASESSSGSTVAEEEIILESSEEVETVKEEATNGNVYSGTCGNNLTWTLDDAGTLTISGTGKMTDYSWNNYLFKDYIIKKAIINNGVTSIGDGAFIACTSLASVTIPEGVTSIGNHAFQYCSSLTSVTIPNSMTSIADWTFSGCTSLASVTIGNSVKSIGRCAFYDCSSLKSVTIPNNVTSIESSTFSGCSSLTSVTIPASVTSIGYSAFEKCSSLKSVTIPNSVTSIGEEAFGGCSRLTSVTIPNSVTSIESSTFSGCSSLTSVTIPNSVTSIGYMAFEGCTSLTSVTIPSSVTSIGEGAFGGCSRLKKIYFKGDAPNIYIDPSRSSLSAFYGVTADAYYPLNNKTWTEDKLQNYGGHLTWITQLSLKNATVTGIKDRTFTKTVRSEGATQSITVKLNNKKLKNGTDYKVSYENNKEAGTATVVITGKGKYVGSVKKSFKINLAKPSLASLASKNHGRVSCKINTVYGATGYQIHYVDTKTNEKNTFTGKLKENSKNMTVPGLVGGHTYKFKVRAYRSVNGSPKSAWSKEKSIKVYRGKSIADGTVYIEGAVDGKGKKFTYRGSQIKPTVQLKLKSKILTTTLKQDSDYKVSYTNNTNAGTATITFKGIGKYYGTLKKTFKIDKYTLKSSDVTIGSTTYTAKKANPTVTVKVNSKKQKENVDYKASTSSVNAGTGKMTVKGIGKNLTGTVTKNFKIRPLDINKCTVELPDGDSYAYTGEHIRPIVVVTYNGTNVPYEPDKTFDIDDSQSQNVEAGDGYITIVGRGNLTGSVKKNIEIRAGFLWPTEAKNNTVSTLFYYSGDYKKNPHGNHGVGNPIDIPGTIGDDIYAVADGTVEDASYGAYGNHIYIRLEDGSKLIYGHLNAFHVKKDDKVKAGQVIGELGNTGNSTGPHLHFAWEGGNAWSKYYKNYPGFHLKYQTSVYEANNYHYNEDSRSAEVIDWFKEHYFKDGEFQGVWVQ